MTDFTIASFNVKNLIGPDQEYYRFERYTPEEYAWKQDWLAEQVTSLNADIICFQEIFEASALKDVIAAADAEGTALNAEVIPGRDKRYRRKAIFEKLRYEAYGPDAIAFAPNAQDTGQPGQRRPGLAIVSRFGFVSPPQAIQVLDHPVEIPFSALTGETSAGSYRIERLSRPIQRAEIAVGDQRLTVFNCHLKSKLGEYPRPDGAAFAPEADLTRYDPRGRMLGSLRAAVRRMAEAWVLRGLVLDALERGGPVLVLGDFNDGEHAVSTEIIAGETPFRNYAWMRRHDAEHAGERYSEAEAAQIREAIQSVRLYSAERMFIRKSQRDMVYTTAFGGQFQSIDQIFMSRHFHPEAAERIGEMTYFSVLNDHLTDGSHAEAPYNKLASDHGQIMAHFRLD